MKIGRDARCSAPSLAASCARSRKVTSSFRSGSVRIRNRFFLLSPVALAEGRRQTATAFRSQFSRLKTFEDSAAVPEFCLVLALGIGALWLISAVF
jgi:hypothetical protein